MCRYKMKNLLLTAQLPFVVEQGKTYKDVESESSGAEDSAKANVRKGDKVAKKGNNRFWVTPGSSDKEFAQN